MNSFSDIGRKYILPNMIGAVTATIIFGKIHFLLISENDFTYEINVMEWQVSRNSWTGILGPTCAPFPILVLPGTIWSFQVLTGVPYLWQAGVPKMVLGSTCFPRVHFLLNNFIGQTYCKKLTFILVWAQTTSTCNFAIHHILLCLDLYENSPQLKTN